MSKLPQYVDVDKDTVRKFICCGEKCINRDVNDDRLIRYIGFIKELFLENGIEYAYVDFSIDNCSYYENPTKEKIRVDELGFWINEANSFFDIDGKFVCPF